MYLNKDVAVRVAATLMNAVVAAVVMIVVVGIGTSISVNGISTICASGGWGGLVDFGFEALQVACNKVTNHGAPQTLLEALQGHLEV